jgi:hypothetical protein
MKVSTAAVREKLEFNSSWEIRLAGMNVLKSDAIAFRISFRDNLVFVIIISNIV